MFQAHRNQLRTKRVELVHDLVVDMEFLSVLQAEDLFTVSMCEEILAKTSTAGKAGTMLDLLVRRGPKAYSVLIKALIHTKQTPIAESLDPRLTQEITAEWVARSGGSPPAPPCRVVHPMEETTKQPSSGFDEQPFLAELIKSMRFSSINDEGTHSLLKEVDLGDVYRLQKKPRGRALIINNSDFEQKLPTREGAEFDGVNLCELFQTLFFETDLKSNLTAHEMKKVLLQEIQRQEHIEAEAFVLCVLSHGAHGVVYGVDGGELDIDKHIIQMFKGSICPNLLHKPKIIIIQACQGSDGARAVIQSDGPESPDAVPCEEEEKMNAAFKKLSVGDKEGSVLPEMNSKETHDLADMLVAYATCPGYKSFRQTNLGSWFIRDFIKQMCAHASTKHLVDILTRVRRSVLEQKTNQLWFDKPHYIQLTETRTTLLKNLFWFPGYAESKC